MEVPRGGKDGGHLAHLPCSLSSSWAMHNSAPPICSEGRGGQRVALEDPLPPPRVSAPEAEDHKTRDCPQPPKAGVSLGPSRGVQRRPVPSVPSQVSELQLTGAGGLGEEDPGDQSLPHPQLPGSPWQLR